MNEIFGNPAFMVCVKLLALAAFFGFVGAVRADWQTFKKPHIGGDEP